MRKQKETMELIMRERIRKLRLKVPIEAKKYYKKLRGSWLKEIKHE